MYDKRV
jgi:hypothetical protein